MKAVAEIHDSEAILLLYYYAFKGKLLSGLIHNVGSPLQSVMFLVELMGSTVNLLSDFDETAKPKLDIISREVKIIADTFSDFRILQQLADSEEEVLDVCEFYHLITRILKADIFCKHNVSISIKSSLRVAIPQMPSRVFVIMFVELVRNALKAIKSSSDKGGVEFCIDPSTLSKHEIIVRVIDTGCGWDPDFDSSLLFQPSYSSWDFPKEDFDEIPSFGLGLCCIQDLLSIYGGSISVNRDNNFTQVEMKIPARMIIP
ncbi:MAG: ATP-binding protein [Thermodesulforhabdaceae bacterium]